jgi:hypothetical protein
MSERQSIQNIFEFYPTELSAQIVTQIDLSQSLHQIKSNNRYNGSSKTTILLTLNLKNTFSTEIGYIWLEII